MFYSTYILQKKGPLAKIWIAAHWEKKLTRSDIKLVDISEIVVQLINPNVPIALRTSGELLYGVVRIFADKVKFLLQEAQSINYRIRTLGAPSAAGASSSAAAGGPFASVTEKITLPGTSATRIPTGADLETTILPSEVVDTIQTRGTMFPQSATISLEILRPADQVGDLDEWTLIPGEKPLDTSLEGFPLLPEDREHSPKPRSEASESSTTVSSTERLRVPRETPTGAAARRDDIHVAMSVEELFKQPELTTPEREQAGALPVPSPFDISGAGVSGGDVTRAAAAEARPEKKRKLKIDTSTTLDDRHLKSRMEDTLDTLRPGSCFPKSLTAMRVKAFLQSDHEAKMKVISSELTTELPELLMKAWKDLTARSKPTTSSKSTSAAAAAAAAEDEDTEVIRKERERASMGGDAGAELDGSSLLPPPPEFRGSFATSNLTPPLPPPPPPMTEVELQSFEMRKRRAEEIAMEAKRRRLEAPATSVVDLGQTFAETLARLRKLCKAGESVSFSKLTRRNARRSVATQFYDLLVLKSTDQIEVAQAKPYGEIIITPTPLSVA